jgi:ureidoacrylate peracid hydrolase
MTLPAPDETVLCLVDYQNDFCHPDGAIARLGQSTEAARALLPRLLELVDAARAAEVWVVYARVAHSRWTDAPAWRRRGAGGEILDTERIRVAEEGTWGADLYELAPRPDELVMTKHRYSAFAHTPLRLVLQSRPARCIALAGVQTNVCVHATARDAIQDGFLPIVVEDCVAASTPAEHEGALLDIRARMGASASLEEVRKAWGV